MVGGDSGKQQHQHHEGMSGGGDDDMHSSNKSSSSDKHSSAAANVFEGNKVDDESHDHLPRTKFNFNFNVAQGRDKQLRFTRKYRSFSSCLSMSK